MKQYVTTIDGNSVYYHPDRNSVTIEIFDKKVVKKAKKICKQHSKMVTDIKTFIEKPSRQYENEPYRREMEDNKTDTFSWWFERFFDDNTKWFGPPLDLPIRRIVATIVASYFDPAKTAIYEDVDQYKEALKNYDIITKNTVPAFLSTDTQNAESSDKSVTNRYLYIRPDSFFLWRICDDNNKRKIIIDALKEHDLLELTESGSPMRKIAGTRHYCINCNKIEKFIIYGMIVLRNMPDVFWINEPRHFLIGLSVILDDKYLLEDTEDLNVYKEAFDAAIASKKEFPDLIYYDNDDGSYTMSFSKFKSITSEYFPGFDGLPVLTNKFSDGKAILEVLDEFDGIVIPHVRIDIAKLLIASNTSVCFKED